MRLRDRIARLFRRRPKPAYHGWQDVDWIDESWEMPAPEQRAKMTLPELQPWQENLLRTHGWAVRDQMLRAHRRPEDARISLHHARKIPDGLTVFGIRVRLDPNIPPGEVHVEVLDRIGGIVPPGFNDNSVVIGRHSWKLPQ